MVTNRAHTLFLVPSLLVHSLEPVFFVFTLVLTSCPIMIPQTIQTLVQCARPSREDFVDSDSAAQISGWSVAAMLITLIIIIIFVTFVGYYLWNSVVAGAGKNDTGLFTCVRRADSMWQILGLWILISLFFGGCCATPQGMPMGNDGANGGGVVYP